MIEEQNSKCYDASLGGVYRKIGEGCKASTGGVGCQTHGDSRLVKIDVQVPN
jgi:hypothetical protein